jgi:hypothetical protein
VTHGSDVGLEDRLTVKANETCDAAHKQGGRDLGLGVS